MNRFVRFPAKGGSKANRITLKKTKMNEKYIKLIAEKLGVREIQVKNTAFLFSQGATVPFISRYRKEQTGLLNEVQVAQIKDELKKFAYESDFMFDEDTLTDQPERVLAAEMIREKLLRLLDKEIPHGTAVVIERMRTRDESNIIDKNTRCSICNPFL